MLQCSIERGMRARRAEPHSPNSHVKSRVRGSRLRARERAARYVRGARASTARSSFRRSERRADRQGHSSGQAKRQPSAVVRVLHALDQSSAHQRIDRSADCRRAARDRPGHLAEGRRARSTRLPRGVAGERGRCARAGRPRPTSAPPTRNARQSPEVSIPQSRLQPSKHFYLRNVAWH